MTGGPNLTIRPMNRGGLFLFAVLVLLLMELVVPTTYGGLRLVNGGAIVKEGVPRIYMLTETKRTYATLLKDNLLRLRQTGPKKGVEITYIYYFFHFFN